MDTAQLRGLDRIVARLRAMAAKASKDAKAVAVTGYATDYAIYVHEDLEAQHKPGKQAKFLEQPAREMKKELGRGIREDVAKGMTLAQALLRAALKLQRASQKIVPVDTGNLKNTAFTRLE